MNRTTRLASLASVALVVSSGCANTVALRDPRQVAGVEARSGREEGTMVLHDGREYPAKFVRYEGGDVIWVSDAEEHRMAASEVRGVRFEQRNVARVQGILAGFAGGMIAGAFVAAAERDGRRTNELDGIDTVLSFTAVGMLTGAGVGSLFTAPVTYEWEPREMSYPAPSSETEVKE